MKNILLFTAILGFVTAHAQDRIFTYTYQSGVLNKGQKEIEIWTTMKNGKENYYRGFDHRMEYEVGLGSKLQTSFYLNYGYGSAIEDQNGVQTLNSFTDYSFSNEWKLKLSDPVANRLGSALYFEYSLGPTETELEGKIILDKHVGNFIHAFNAVGEYEIEKQFVAEGTNLKPVNHGELALELNYGLAYHLKNNMSLGLEAMNQNIVDNSIWEHSVLSAGPCFSWATNGFWINLTFMPQIVNLKGGGLELHDNQKYQTRLIFSYAF